MARKWQAYQAHAGATYNTVVGNVKVREKVWSPQLNNHRDVLVYVPPSYREGNGRYPVVYMHDGQNLFDQATSYAGEWQVDETMEQLGREGIEAIIAGVANTGVARMAEYSPFVDGYFAGGRGPAYLAFIVSTLKPLIDRDFRTKPGREHTGMVGSSMGGLISLYGFFAHPETFGFVGVMSPSLWYAHGAIYDYVERAAFAPGRIYLDAGTREFGGHQERSRRYYGSVRKMQRLLVKKGYRPTKDLLYVQEKHAPHQEGAWARRLPEALRFLLGGNGPQMNTDGHR